RPRSTRSSSAALARHARPTATSPRPSTARPWQWRRSPSSMSPIRSPPARPWWRRSTPRWRRRRPAGWTPMAWSAPWPTGSPNSTGRWTASPADWTGWAVGWTRSAGAWTSSRGRAVPGPTAEGRYGSGRDQCDRPERVQLPAPSPQRTPLRGVLGASVPGRAAGRHAAGRGGGALRGTGPPVPDRVAALLRPRAGEVAGPRLGGVARAAVALPGRRRDPPAPRAVRRCRGGGRRRAGRSSGPLGAGVREPPLGVGPRQPQRAAG